MNSTPSPLTPTGDTRPVLYYRDEYVEVWLGDGRDVSVWLEAAVLLVDPPYGINYRSGSPRENLADHIDGDTDTTVRDDLLTLWRQHNPDRPALVFGSWKIPRPTGTHTRLIWDTKGALGMGDLTVPWKPSDQEIYVLGHGFQGRRTSNVLVCPPVQSMARNGRNHPHEKPVALLAALLEKCPPGVIADPCAGSGSLGVAAKLMGRRAVLVESDPQYLPVIVRRLRQDALTFGPDLDEAAS